MKKMLKRADGSYSQRGLWDNIRANKGSGKKPTKEMLEQEAKIKSKKQTGGLGKPEKATADSTAYYKNKEQSFRQLAKSEKGDTKVSKFNKDFFEGEANKAVSNQLRQYHKGKPGFDKNGNPSKSQVKSIKPNWLEESKELMFGGATDRYGNTSSTSRKTGGKKKYQTAGPKFTVTGNLGALQGGTGCVSGSCKEVMASEGTSYKGNGTNYTGPGAAQLSMKPKYQDRVVKKSAEQIAIDQGKIDAAQAKMAANQADRQARREANLAAFKEATAPKPEVQYDFKRVYATEPALKKTGGKKKSNWLDESKELKFGGKPKKYQTAGPTMSFQDSLKEYMSGKMTADQARAASGVMPKPKKYTDAENIDNLKKVFVGSHTVDAQGNVVAKPAKLKTGGKKKRMGGKNC